MAPTATLIANPTNNTPAAATITQSTGWAQWDIVIVLVEDLATGATCALNNLTPNSGQQLEGLAINTGTGNMTVEQAKNDGTRFLSMWSARIDALAATGGFTTSIAYGAGAGVRRSQIWRFRPSAGKIPPVRASRTAGFVLVSNTTNGAPTTDSFNLSGGTALDCFGCLFYYTANTMTNVPTWDVANDGATTTDLNADNNTSGCGSFGHAYAAADTGRPSNTSPFTSAVKWNSNPGSGGKVFVAFVMLLEPAPLTQTVGPDALGLSDPAPSISHGFQPIQGPDALGLSDPAPSIARGFNRVLTDPLGFLDTALPGAGAHLSATLNDPLGLTDNTHVSTINVSLTDPLGLTDRLPRQILFGITDPLGLQDAGITTVGQPERLGFTDAVFTALTKGLVLTDQLGLADGLLLPRTLTVSLTDQLGLADATGLVGLPSVQFGDRLTFDDFVFTFMQKVLTQIDPLGLTDNLSAGILRGAQPRDFLTLADAIQAQRDLVVLIADSIGFTDKIPRLLTVLLSDRLGLSDHAGGGFHPSLTGLLLRATEPRASLRAIEV